MPVKVKFKASELHRLTRQPKAVLRALDVPLWRTVRDTHTIASFLVPRGDDAERDWSQPSLADTSFISGPEHRLDKRLSVSWTAGYEHPSAGPIHEGFHYGDQIFNPPSHWLKRSFRKTRGAGRKGVAKALADFLKSQFPAR
ncbi:hypothetical protein HUA74_02700 [Myxococcus sp. CA051A]|uniref:Uncharacterized protein n=1 Tax=Myxococcus llanfairpwllgwyngyllgogerychwyrndrobwllllantysiliogogogochensis TaxID=2590453 RepID=A0A540WYH3_9BACT|nr:MULTISPECIES: hypothetical protein [Myxococcus]NTX59563.1 hypothetical protein [Myxococcus sp. CA051A]TQF14048.1 hypothetical protein FJV41_20840 [Myxococcus llanfairpwllgwyngyllgogerychwyrndrobwllllantysiliogogogochensis]